MQPLIINVYVPLCSESCVFCERLTTPSTVQSVARYHDALVAELESVAPEFDGYQVEAVRFSGGVPLLLGGANIADIVFRMRKTLVCSADAEITVETVPGKLDEHNLRLFRHVGITRLEFGLATFVQSEHARLRCPGLYGQLYDHDAMRRYLGPEDWGCNLIFGLPGQTLVTWERTLRKVIDMKPAHVNASRLRTTGRESACFCDESADDFSRAQTESDLVRMYEVAVDCLVEAGYHRFAHGRFVRPGYRCRHTELAQRNVGVLGLGAGARSRYGGYSYRNTTNVEEYMRHSSDPEAVVRDVGEIGVRERLLLEIAHGLLLESGLSIPEAVSRAYSQSVSAPTPEPDSNRAVASVSSALAILSSEKLVERLSKGRYRLTAKGFVYCDEALTMFDGALDTV